jgi:nucleoside-diphosphate-sugar epimerase
MIQMLEARHVKEISSAMKGRTVLITGASGVVGQALIEKLGDTKTFCLVHQTPVNGENLISVQSNITQPNLGLTNQQFNELASQVDAIIHSAAITDFSAPEEIIHRTNVNGTKHILELAATAEAPLYYISTAFAHVHSHDNDDSSHNAYEVSKQESERVVRESGLPHVIVRPSVVVGNANTGAIANFQGFHSLLTLFVKGFLPVAPALPDAQLDFIPQDSVAEAVVALVEHRIEQGEYWLTAGSDALTLQELVDVCIDNGERLLGRAVEKPRMVGPEMFDRLIRPVFLPALPAHRRRIIEQALQLAKYLYMTEPFPTSFPTLGQELNVAPLPNLKHVLVRNLEYLVQKNKLARNKAKKQLADA